MDGIEGIVVAFVELIVVAVQLVAYFILFLFELLIWGILAIQGKKGERPKMNLLSKERVKERVLQKALIFFRVHTYCGRGHFTSTFSVRALASHLILSLDYHPVLNMN